MRSRQDPGRLLVVDARQPDAAVPLYPANTQVGKERDAGTFAPHGLNIRQLDNGQFELLVVDHGGGEAIDRFTLQSRGDELPIVRQVTRIELPEGAWANGVAPLPGGGLIITSMYDPRDGTFLTKFAKGEATGGLWSWSPTGGWRGIPHPRLSGANGIAVSRDGRFVFAAEWAARRIWRIPLDGGEPRAIRTSFLPDNLRWTAQGDLLIAGQHAKPEEVFTCSLHRLPCPMGFTVARIDPATLTVTPVLSGDEKSFGQTGFGGATGALQVGNAIWVGSFTGDRIARFAISVSQP